MRVSLELQDERLELDLPDEALVGVWDGPSGMTREAGASTFKEVLEHPLDFPPMRQMVVAGDRVAIALDASVNDAPMLIRTMVEVLSECGIDPEETTVVATEGSSLEWRDDVHKGLTLEVHDPADTSNLAYLATTQQGRRIYLNRRLTDADVVIPVGRIGFDPLLGFRGPWSALFPGLSDQDTKAEYRLRFTDDPPGRAVPRARLDEPLEVSWLLGTQFQVGIIPGMAGTARFVVGKTEAVRDRGIEELDRLWSFHAPSRAECVVVGIGCVEGESDLANLAEGLVTASRIVQHGGRIIALSRARGPLGPALHRLIDAGDVKDAASALRGHEADVDFVAARQLARVLGWADVYLLSGLARETVEDLFMVPVDHLDDARRLILRSGSALVVGQAQWTRATADDDQAS